MWGRAAGAEALGASDAVAIEATAGTTDGAVLGTLETAGRAALGAPFEARAGTLGTGTTGECVSEATVALGCVDLAE